MARITVFKKGEKVQLSKNFDSTEWDCNCTYPECQTTSIDLDHVDRLQAMRDKWGKPVNLHSGFRCPRHNQEEGGAPQSRHLVSDATDIVVDGMTPDEVANDCDPIFQGMGHYDDFTHIDSRGTGKARWDFRKK